MTRHFVDYPVQVENRPSMLLWPVKQEWVVEYCPTQKEAKKLCDELNIKDIPRKKYKHNADKGG